MSQPSGDRPIKVDEGGGGIYLSDVYEFLDELRESGVTNMFGAAPYIEDEFFCSRETANKLLGWWMQDFSK